MTDAQLDAVRFTGCNLGWPFDQWSFTWGTGTPMEMLGHLKAFSALKWLIFENPPHSRDKDDAWRLVNETLAAPVYRAGCSHKAAQQKRARKPRGKVGDDGSTMEQIVQELARAPERRDDTARELWPHFFSKLGELQLDPSDKGGPEPRKRYYTYDFKDKRKRVTFGRFANLVTKARRGRNSR
jgi:hypothetical protein